MRIRTLLVTAILSVFGMHGTVHAAPKVCRAPYAIQSSSFECDAFMASQAAQKDLRISFLWHTFDTGGRCLEEKVFPDPRLRWVQIALVNDTCTRDADCGAYELLAGMKPREVARAFARKEPRFLERYRAHAARARDWLLPKLRPDVECRVSPLLESNVNEAAARVAIEETRAVFGARCKVVWNPAGINKVKGLFGADFYEEHGTKVSLSAPCIANLDGEDISFETRPARLKNSAPRDAVKEWAARVAACDAVCLWVAEDNCLGGDRSGDPRDRQCRNGGAFDLVGELQTEILGRPSTDSKRGGGFGGFP